MGAMEGEEDENESRKSIGDLTVIRTQLDSSSGNRRIEVILAL